MTFRTRPWLRRTAIAIAALLGIVVIVVVAFDWNWLRGPLERHLAKTSGRDVRIGALHVDFGFSLEPTVRLNDVFVANAPWATSKKPLVTAREVRFVVPLSGLIRDPLVVSRIVVNDAEIEMERRADGLRNWRLNDPDERGPGRVQVRLLEARRSSLHFINAGIDLELFMAASDAESSEALPIRVEFKGRYQGRDFTGAGLTGPVMSFRASSFVFPVRGHIDATGTRLDVDGTASDIFEPGLIDVQARLKGPSLADVHPFLRIRPAQSRPYSLRTRITHRDRVFHFEQIVGRLGGTPGTAQATYDRRGERPQLEAVLDSEGAEFADVSPLIGIASPGVAQARRAAKDATKSGGPAGIGKPLPLDALRAFDLKVLATARRLSIAGITTLTDPRVEAVLRNGLLEARPLTFRVAGGQGTGSVTLDAREASAAATVAAELRRIEIEKLVPALERDQRAAAVMSARMKLSGRGLSAFEILSNAAGSADARIESGRLSNRIDAKLGLDYGKVLRSFFQSERDIAIRCGALTLDVHNGVGTTRSLAVDTEQTRVPGKGTLNLRDQRIDLVLSPEPKNPGLFTRRASIMVRGPLSKPDVSVGDRVELPFKDCGAGAQASRP